MTIYYCPLCRSEYTCWDDSWLCFGRCVERADQEVHASRNVKLPELELVCECAAADLDRRGLRFFSSARAGLRPRIDKSGYWMLVHRTSQRDKLSFFLYTYCPFCGRKPRMFRNAEREPVNVRPPL